MYDVQMGKCWTSEPQQPPQLRRVGMPTHDASDNAGEGMPEGGVGTASERCPHTGHRGEGQDGGKMIRKSAKPKCELDGTLRAAVRGGGA